MKFISKIQPDKLLHFICGLLIAQWVTYFVDQPLHKILIGIAAGSVAAIFKEAFDKFILKEVFDYKDIMATVVGSAIGATMIAFA